MARQPCSLVVITRNAAREIGPCLDSAGLADDVLVVDSGSEDGTPELARARGARVLSRPFAGFGPQKRFAVGEARHDWVLCLDADERLSPELARSIEACLEAPATAAYALNRRNRFLGRWLAHGEGYPDWTVRLFDRRRAQWSEDAVHERVVFDGAPGRLAGDLLHESAESLADYLDKQNRYTTLQAQAMRRAGERAGLAQLVGSPLARFLRFYLVRGGFLDGLPGLAHIAVGSFFAFVKYAKLVELRLSSGPAAAREPDR